MPCKRGGKSGVTLKRTRTRPVQRLLVTGDLQVMQKNIMMYEASRSVHPNHSSPIF